MDEKCKAANFFFKGKRHSLRCRALTYSFLASVQNPSGMKKRDEIQWGARLKHEEIQTYQ